MYTRQTYYLSSSITIAYDAHGILGGASTWARGGNFSIGFASGAVASSITSCTGDLVDKLPTGWKITCMVAAGGLSGGVTASMAGGSFWEGVCNGLICSGLNHALHLTCEKISGPDEPPGNKKNEVQRLAKRAGNAPTVVGAEATIIDEAAKLTIKREGKAIGLNRISNIADKAGRWCLVLNGFANGVRAYNGDITATSAIMRSIMSVAEYASFKIPFVGPFVGVGLFYLDVTGVFDRTLYNDAWLYDKSQYIKYDYAPTYYQYTPSYQSYY
ncbi:MAG: hypothetical protein IKN08_01845 [Bacteroidales bacterium]|nr:hypothetical protein [Bacteroidales bacterium]MBR6227580.1 hypothetical protein [Bacteroidales bacterium]